jgi:hypothetical protein
MDDEIPEWFKKLKKLLEEQEKAKEEKPETK